MGLKPCNLYTIYKIAKQYARVAELLELIWKINSWDRKNNSLSVPEMKKVWKVVMRNKIVTWLRVSLDLR